MSAGPLRRATGAIGLLVLLPVVVLFATGALSPEQAALRALTILVVTLLVGRLASVVVRLTLRRFEPGEDTSVTAPNPQAAAPAAPVAPAAASDLR